MLSKRRPISAMEILRWPFFVQRAGGGGGLAEEEEEGASVVAPRGGFFGRRKGLREREWAR